MLEKQDLNRSVLVRLTEESSNSLFEALEEWEHHLTSTDFDSLGGDDDEFTP
jgi:hypothetical protein